MDVRKFIIKPRIPEKLKPLEELSENLWSFWDKDAERLFHRIDPKLFRKLNHSPVELLYNVKPERIAELAKDKGFLYELKQVQEKFINYMKFEGAYNSKDGHEHVFTNDDIISYNCMEYGLHESLPIYSGGLAILAGDQLKASSDVGIPFVSFGLLYKHGYFVQKIASDGTQIEEFKECNWYLTPIKEVLKEDDSPLIIEIPLKNEVVFAKVWMLSVGRTKLYLFDTAIHQNSEEIRKITDMLYDSDKKTRIEQELILGRGSVIALKALGITPKVYHINEGHTAFSILERLIELIKVKKYTFDEAKNIIRCSTVFTTHTPVVEGNEHYPDDLIKEYLEKDVKSIGLTMGAFLSLGKIREEKVFWLPAFAIRFSRLSNGVSKIHADVSRKMWRNIFPTLHEREIPIGSVTNGVHLQSWLSLQMTDLFDRYVGPDYFHKAEVSKVWENINEIPDSEIWNAHVRRKEQVVTFLRRRISRMMTGRGYGNNNIKDVEDVLNPSYLTIGFARRFAPYKRANLILTDPERLAAIITNKEKPVQIVFAGKAHPADGEGKKIIKDLFSFIAKYGLEKHIVFIENYDINIARHLVQGVDIWLNTPAKPMEASGTSGMKAAINGILNLSISDGWWPEAYNGENGWIIAEGEGIDNYSLKTNSEASNLYDLLENEITELYYNRKEDGYPVEWVKMMKNSIISVCKQFNMHRAVREYLYDYYLPQIDITEKVLLDNGHLLKEINVYKKKIDLVWPKIFLKDYFTSIDGKTPFTGDEVTIESYVYLDDTDENLVNAEVVYFFDGEKRKTNLQFIEKYQDKVAKYTGSIVLEGNGIQELSVRLVPSDEKFRLIYPEYAKWKA